MKIAQNPRRTYDLGDESLQAGPASSPLEFLIKQSFVILISAGEFERIRYRRFSFLHAGDHVRAAEPVGFGEIGWRPLGGMVGMGVVEADDIFSAVAAFALDANQFARIDVVAVVRRVGPSVAAARRRGHARGRVIFEAAEQHAAAFVWVGFFAVLAEGAS